MSGLPLTSSPSEIAGEWKVGKGLIEGGRGLQLSSLIMINKLPRNFACCIVTINVVMVYDI